MINKLKKAAKILIGRKSEKVEMSAENKIQLERVKPWFAIQGDTTIRMDYDLNSNSIVFDLGGYKGEYSADIFCKYNPYIYIFEPVESFFKIINNKFSNNIKVKSYNFGLASTNQQMQIFLSDNSSSMHIKSDQTEVIELKSIVEFLQKEEITQVDLIKINIEGGEYDVLEALIDNNLISIFKNIQVQFHDFIIENAKQRMESIQRKLSETHEITYQYEFVWENWKIK